MATPRQLILREKQRTLRSQLFPDVTPAQIWERHSKTGFATVPRALPLVMVLMDELSPKKPVRLPYFALWCRAWDDPMVNIGSKLLEIALESGFTGQRAENSLCARLAILAKLGFVRFAPGVGGQYSFALLLNPCLELKKQEKRLSKYTWNALLSRMNEIGADDFHPERVTVPPAPKNAAFSFTPAPAPAAPILLRRAAQASVGSQK